MPTILLVEDDRSLSQLIEQHLTESGFSVIAAPGTVAALDQVRADRKIDLLLVDLVMPADQPNGLAFAVTVKMQAPQLPVIFMTGYYGFVARAGELPGSVLYKPVDLDVLTREIYLRLNA